MVVKAIEMRCRPCTKNKWFLCKKGADISVVFLRKIEYDSVSFLCNTRLAICTRDKKPEIKSDNLYVIYPASDFHDR